jgi:hypothetical protein
MLTFLSHYPENTDDARDGMSQRIAAIDSIFEDVERVYLNISFRTHKRHRVRSQGLAQAEIVNFYLHHKLINRHLRQARLVYAHTIHNAIFALPYFRYLKDKLILDLHGIVPEETLFLGHHTWARILARVEKSAVSNSQLIIAVTQRMADHLLCKYPAALCKRQILVLPNVDLRREKLSPVFPEHKAHRGLRLIYAGTVGPWQNTDLMLQTLRRVTAFHSSLRAHVYVHPESLDRLKEEVIRLRLDSHVVVASLPHDMILKEYANADAGFVLRDDILLNRVAMPTKLAEYMVSGVVPIVLSPDLGDFLSYGYRYLTIEDLCDADKLSPAALSQMRKTNFGIMAAIFKQAAEAKKVLQSVVTPSDADLRPLSHR